MRLLALALFALLCAAAWVSISPLDRPMLVDASVSKVALKDYPKDHMLYAPCPGGMFAPRPKRNVV